MKNNKATALGILVTLGIVFGDIGTSPLYVWKAIIGEQIISKDLILGSASLIFWTLVIQTTIKYMVMTLRADNDGQGGIFALYSLIRGKQPKKIWLYIAIFGSSCLLADCFITPAISISSAVEGLLTLSNTFHPNTMLVTAGIVFLLFVVQQGGTARVGRIFGPIMIVWFGMLFVLGVHSMATYPTIIYALSPYYGLHLIFSTPGLAFVLASGVFLCTTGAEGLYSDLGHCGRANIRLAWICVKIALVANYFGQAAWLLSREGSGLQNLNPFYAIMPSWLLPYGIIVATIAAIIASQALISASFTLISEGIKLNLLPKWKIIYPSQEQGQLYVPMINGILCVGCLLVVFSFQTSTAMEGAYGLAIINTMLLTTILLLQYMKQRGYKMWFIVAWAIFYLSGEGFFLAANSKKFFDGGWATLLIAGIFAFIMVSWYLYELLKRRIISQKTVNIPKFAHDVALLHEMLPLCCDVLVLLSKTNAGEIDARLLKQVQRGRRAKLYVIVHIDTASTPFENTWHIQRHDNVCLINVKRGFQMKANIGSDFRKFLDEQGIPLPKNINGEFPVFQFLAVDNHVVSDLWYVTVSNYIKKTALVTLDHFFPNAEDKQTIKLLITE